MKDIHLNEYGDLEVGPDGDLFVVRDDDVIVDNILFRLRTYKGDWILEPNCGTPLEDVIGLPNIESTGKYVESVAIAALTHDGFLTEDQIDVRCSPLNSTTLILVTQYHGTKNYSIYGTIDLSNGNYSITR